jgi:crotonobetainyl-CoA:carnitine CoA-transferase CaiB-like acyl-CoA transferase
MTKLPLSGVRVLDIASLYAAPLAASFLADFGADVIKIEPPGGDGFRGTRMWPVVARGKRSLVLDLRNPDDCGRLRKLVRCADVLVENFPEAVLKARGLDWNTLSSINPRLVMLSLSCFGQTGPYAGRPGSGTIGEGFAGLTHLTGERSGPPTLSSVALGDAIGAMNAVIGVMIALYGRDRNGLPGQQVDATLYEPVLTAIAQAFQFHEPGLGQPTRNGSKMAGGSGLRNTFAASDGGFVVISASTVRHFEELVALAGGHSGDDADALVADWISRRPVNEVVRDLIERRIPVSPVNDIDAILSDPHAVSRQSLVELDDDELGKVVMASPSPRLSTSPGRLGGLNPALDGAAGTVWQDWGAQ